MCCSKRTPLILTAVIVLGSVIAYMLHVQSEFPAAPATASKASASEPTDPLADAAMKKLDTAFPGTPGAEPSGVVIFGQSGARYILSPDAIADFLGRDTSAPGNANALRYTVRVAGNTVTVEAKNRGPATTVVLTLPPPGTTPGKVPPLTVTTKDASGTVTILTVPVAEYARDSNLVKVAADGSATFILPDNGVAIKQGRIYNANVSMGGNIILEGGSLSFGGNTATH